MAHILSLGVLCCIDEWTFFMVDTDLWVIKYNGETLLIVLEVGEEC